MLPDFWGSDVDYSVRMGHEFSEDRREDWCEDHRQQASTCGPCHAAGRLDHNPLLDAVRRHTDQMSVAKLRHLADSDEETGAGLAARFGGA